MNMARSLPGRGQIGRLGREPATFLSRTPRVTGMPLQPGNLSGNAHAYPKPMVFITGGSQGSVRLNELAVGLAKRWAAINIVLQEI